MELGRLAGRGELGARPGKGREQGKAIACKARQHATGARPLATPAHASITSPFSPHHHPILQSSDTRPPCTTTITPRTSPASLQCHHSTYAPSLPLPAWSDTGRGWYGTTRIYASARAYWVSSTLYTEASHAPSIHAADCAPAQLYPNSDLPPLLRKLPFCPGDRSPTMHSGRRASAL